MNPIIHTQALTKTFGSDGAAVHALRGIDLTIREGEFVALIGPSGSGKSTLMAILGCLDSPIDRHLLARRRAGRGPVGPRARARSATRRSASSSSSTTCCPRPRCVRNVELPMLYAGISRKERRRAGARAAREGRHPRQGEGPAGGALGRPAPARRGRARPGQPAGAAAGRRADRRPRFADRPRGPRALRASCTARATRSSSSPTTSRSPRWRSARSRSTTASTQAARRAPGGVGTPSRHRAPSARGACARTPGSRCGRTSDALDPAVARRHPRASRRCSAGSRSPTACASAPTSSSCGWAASTS